ncbi:TBC1 domain family member 20 isoform X2 [Anthonomus grandis grandis]|uniref:TBC1 domain family member 20 isoform X2 n=1 Tax=Anthonomus grandis grandis TaxID=2921223 RepID=UPI0021654795|nr:TBC1 domain family member 20 isoform X2 [Anthonomus grandis grandis]
MENYESEISSLDLEDESTHFLNSNSDRPSENNLEGILDEDAMDTRSELKFERDVETEEEKEKRKRIEAALGNQQTTLKTWEELAKSKCGLVGDDLRCAVWPLLLEVDPSTDERIPSLEELSVHPEYQQVVLDVNRSLKRFPPGIPYEQRLALQDQLTVLILRVIIKYPHLRYYQGYHDVAITFLLVVGEVVAFRIMEKLSINNLRECMEPTMEKTDYRLNYIYALLYNVDRDLYNFMDTAGVGTMFALPWYLTWFGHSLNQYKDVVRLYDYFLASPPLMPLYVATSLVVYRRSEIFAEDCDMASIHCRLSHIPDNVDFETILVKAEKYYKDYPPNKLEKLVKKRVERELAKHKKMRNIRGPVTIWGRLNNHVPAWMVFSRRSRLGLIFATATVLIAYLYYVKFGDVRMPFLSLLNT